MTYFRVQMESVGKSGNRSSTLALRVRPLIQAKMRLEEKSSETTTFGKHLKVGGEAEDNCA